MLFPLANHCLLNSSMLCSKCSCVSIITYFCIIPVQWFLLHLLLTFSHEYSSCTAVLCSQHQPKTMPELSLLVSVLPNFCILNYYTPLSSYFLFIPLLSQLSKTLHFYGQPKFAATRFCCSSYLHAILPKYQVLQELSVSRYKI